MTMDQALFDAIDTPLWIATDDAGETWAGSRYWCVQQYNHAPKDDAVPRLVAMVRDSLHEAVVLDAERFSGGNVYLGVFDRTHAVYVRPDGQRVILNLAFLVGVEKMLQGEDEFGDPTPAMYTLVQAGGPLRPVAFINDDKELLAIIMPVKTG